MARSLNQDFLMTFRFRVVTLRNENDSSRDFLGSATAGLPEAGFATVTIPGISQDAVEYREGHYIFARKMPGIPTVEDCTMTRGIALAESAFWDWARVTREGQGEYRADLQIQQFHRRALQREYPVQYGPGSALVPSETIDESFVERTFTLYDCFPTNCKPASDFDASSAEVSMAELTVAVERVEMNVAPQGSITADANA